MEQRIRDYQQMALAILAIATAALGFALWTQDFDAALPDTGNKWISYLHFVRIGCTIGALIFYFVTFASVAAIVGRRHDGASRNLARQPIVLLYLQMMILAALFLAGFLSDLLEVGVALPMECPPNEFEASPAPQLLPHH